METRCHDVVVLGGGLAGLTLAAQLKRRDPEIDVLVAERAPHPPPQAAHKVGESTLEGGAHYFRNVVGMADHLETQQLRKAGLRFYFSDGSNTDIARRVELGLNIPPAQPSHQIDRGTFEAALADHATGLGAEFLDNCAVRDVTLAEGDGRHRIRLRREGAETEVEARWVVDATGRFGLLKRKLGLTKDVYHKANATWFRVPRKLDMSEWSDDPDWRTAPVVDDDTRWLSTNHIMGYGYWVWFIPLAGEITSVGIVVDDRIYPISEINTLEKSMAWLLEHEPQAHAAVEPYLDEVLDFKFLRHYSLKCERVYSHERWCITGISGCFHDPLFSVGSDMIGYSNGFVTDLITRERAGEDIAARVDLYNQVYLDLVDTVFTIYEDKYPVMENAQVTSVYCHWTTSWYWSVSANLFLHDKLIDLSFLATVSDEIQRAHKLHRVMNAFFVEWNRTAEKVFWSDHHIPFTCQESMLRLQQELTSEWTDEEFKDKFKENLAHLEKLATEIFWIGVQALPDPPERRPIDPYAISLDPARWEADGLFDASERPQDGLDWDAELRDFRFEQAPQAAAVTREPVTADARA
jgi:flavin-dependent dehydrogenase